MDRLYLYMKINRSLWYVVLMGLQIANIMYQVRGSANGVANSEYYVRGSANWVANSKYYVSPRTEIQGPFVR